MVRLNSQTKGILKQIRKSAASLNKQHLRKTSMLKDQSGLAESSSTFPDESIVNDTVSKALRGLSDGDEKMTTPNTGPLKGEWVGNRKNAHSRIVEPDVEELAKCTALMAGISSETTLLLVHGGAH